eukprot:CAMPEP_0182852836 /NCGR_PEP_ID=MMETSP0034_2-20130328/379_1 /TAXON_ID=156128 /ORGANISM="Nephroselmis pyriformis, Strain CCMP717" /LENGTH=412 /DNA_ID=CAMNT_0024983575 /DNA_START=265 /DNA_END=1504 /DNA_ORIENTATION=+
MHIDVSDPNNPDEVITSKLNLVDLAGSERQAHTGAEGEVLKESIKINQSLFSLRQVVASLAQRQRAVQQAEALAASPLPQSLKPVHSIKKGAGAGRGVYAGTRNVSARQRLGSDPKKIASSWHVPYRDSKLTSLLKHSLGGTGLTVIVCCFSPSDEFAEENASTLEFASRARSVRNLMVKNDDPKSRLIREQRETIDRLYQLVSELQGELRKASAGGHDITDPLLLREPDVATATPDDDKRGVGGGKSQVLTLPLIAGVGPKANSESSRAPGSSTGSQRGSRPFSGSSSRPGSSDMLGVMPWNSSNSVVVLAPYEEPPAVDERVRVLLDENEVLRSQLEAALRFKAQASMLAQENAELRNTRSDGGVAVRPVRSGPKDPSSGHFEQMGGTSKFSLVATLKSANGSWSLARSF